MNQQQRTTSDNPPKRASRLGGYRSRYQEFVERQLQKHKPSVPVEQVSQIGQGLTSVVIFVALLVGILTLFGFGLSQWDRNHNRPPESLVQSGKSLQKEAPATLLPSPPAQPAGHSEIKRKTRK
ncbi:MAG: hypothetical protein ACKVX9_13910 [Blastocatellia bacterium]